MIPDEAVEAACASYFSGFPYVHPESKADVRAALDAAAPYLTREAKAEAWDEGYQSGVREEQPDWTPNPYRSQA